MTARIVNRCHHRNSVLASFNGDVTRKFKANYLCRLHEVKDRCVWIGLFKPWFNWPHLGVSVLPHVTLSSKTRANAPFCEHLTSSALRYWITQFYLQITSYVPLPRVSVHQRAPPLIVVATLLQLSTHLSTPK